MNGPRTLPGRCGLRYRGRWRTSCGVAADVDVVVHSDGAAEARLVLRRKHGAGRAASGADGAHAKPGRGGGVPPARGRKGGRRAHVTAVAAARVAHVRPLRCVCPAQPGLNAGCAEDARYVFPVVGGRQGEPVQGNNIILGHIALAPAAAQIRARSGGRAPFRSGLPELNDRVGSKTLRCLIVLQGVSVVGTTDQWRVASASRRHQAARPYVTRHKEGFENGSFVPASMVCCMQSSCK
jgi:hypothetical protein